MPTYEYACDACGTHVDVVHGFHDRGPRKCAECGSAKMRKVFHPAGIVLKGSGFYKTDSRSESAGSSGSSGSSESSGSSGSSGNGASPATKSETKSKPDSDSKSKPASKADSSSKSSD